MRGRNAVSLPARLFSTAVNSSVVVAVPGCRLVVQAKAIQCHGRSRALAKSLPGGVAPACA